jgi:hypothetical protein
MAVLDGAGLRKPRVPGAEDLKRPLLAPEAPTAGAPATPEAKASGGARHASATPARRGLRASGAPAPAARRRAAKAALPRRRRGNVQTVLSLPSDTWDAIDACATYAGTRPGALLDELVRQRGPETASEAGRLLAELLAGGAPVAPKEDRNIRLPAPTRDQLDAHRHALRGAGLREATRSGLVLALWVLRGPQSPDEASDLINAGRLAILERLD